jgi:SAM-dependent methyltransferase
MSLADRDKWNARYRATVDSPDARPSRFLKERAALLPRAGRALDVAGGAGRNAIWLAARGLAVTLVDVSAAGLGLAATAAARAGVRLDIVEADLEAQPLPPGPFDLILCSHYLERRLFSAFAVALPPGGLLLFIQPTVGNLERHSHPSARFLLGPGEGRALVEQAGLTIIEAHEGWWDDGAGEQHLCRVIARRA